MTCLKLHLKYGVGKEPRVLLDGVANRISDQRQGVYKFG